MDKGINIDLLTFTLSHFSSITFITSSLFHNVCPIHWEGTHGTIFIVEPIMYVLD